MDAGQTHDRLFGYRMIIDDLTLLHSYIECGWSFMFFRRNIACLGHAYGICILAALPYTERNMDKCRTSPQEIQNVRHNFNILSSTSTSDEFQTAVKVVVMEDLELRLSLLLTPNLPKLSTTTTASAQSNMTVAWSICIG